MIKNILFDFDGVISDSLEQVIQRWNENSKTYGNSTVLSKELVRNYHTGAWKVFYSEVLGIPTEKIDRASQQYKEIGTRQGVNKIFTNIPDVLEELSKKYPLYLLSSNYELIIERDLKHFGLTKYFKNIAGHEHSNGLDKSSKDFILNSLKDWQLKPEEVVYIGDTSGEVVCGKMAGVTTIGCTWGYQNLKLIQDSKPDFIANGPLDLLQIINKL